MRLTGTLAQMAVLHADPQKGSALAGRQTLHVLVACNVVNE